MTLDLAKLRAETLALIDGTTPGPWDGVGLTVYDTCLDGVASCHTGADARLIAAAPTLAADNLRLLDETERLREALERIEAASRHWAGYEAAPDAVHYAHESTARLARAALAEGDPMTTDLDLPLEAVERLAVLLSDDAGDLKGLIGVGYVFRQQQAAATLRALAAENARLRAERDAAWQAAQRKDKEGGV